MILDSDGSPIHEWIVLRSTNMIGREWYLEASAETREAAETRARELARMSPAFTWAIAHVDEQIHVSVIVEFRRSAM